MLVEGLGIRVGISTLLAAHLVLDRALVTFVDNTVGKVTQLLRHAVVRTVVGIGVGIGVCVRVGIGVRIRVGIGRPSENASEDEIIGFVLSDFAPEEEGGAKKAIAKVSDAIICLITEGLEAAMNAYNSNFANT